MRILAAFVLSISLAAGFSARAAVDVAAEVTIPAGKDMNISFFYESMAPHGAWHNVAEYGWVWQPTIAIGHADWRPYYSGGHWVWTAEFGWYWATDYAWGWAPFHYGRWAYVDTINWVWVPDVTWGPAWVVWRSSDSYYGWAPLPPGATFVAGVGFSYRGRNVGFDFDFGLAPHYFTFVSSNRFLDRNLAAVAVRPAESVNIYKQTTIVKNTYVYQDNRIINNGIPVTQASAATKQEIKPVSVTAVSAEAGAKIPSEQLSGGQLKVFKPEITKEAPKDPKALAVKPATDANKPGTAEQKPVTAPKPEDTKKPETAQKPEDTKKPETAQKPEGTKKPETAQKPEDTKKPETAQKPEDTKKPETAQKPEDTKKPETAKKPERTDADTRSEKATDTSVERSRAAEAPRSERGEERGRYDEKKPATSGERSRAAEAPRSERAKEPKKKEAERSE